jgi:SAM-dependent methyltransferase
MPANEGNSMHQGSRRDTAHDYYEELWTLKAGPAAVRHDGRGATRTDVARRLLVPGDRLLDVGCWGGEGLVRMEATSRFRELYGVDLVPASVERARSRGIQAEVVDLNLQGLPYPDGYFDAVTCLAVVPQVFDPERAVAELSRVVRPGGQLVLSVSNVAFLPIRLTLLRGRLPRTSPDPGWDGGQLHYFTLGATRELVARHSLSIVGIHATGRWLSLRQLWPSLLSRDLVFDLRRSAAGA